MCRLGEPGIKVGCARGGLLVDDGVGASGSGLQHFGLMDDEIKDGARDVPQGSQAKGQGKIW